MANSKDFSSKIERKDDEHKESKESSRKQEKESKYSDSTDYREHRRHSKKSYNSRDSCDKEKRNDRDVTQNRKHDDHSRYHIDESHSAHEKERKSYNSRDFLRDKKSDNASKDKTHDKHHRYHIEEFPQTIEKERKRSKYHNEKSESHSKTKDDSKKEDYDKVFDKVGSIYGQYLENKNPSAKKYHHHEESVRNDSRPKNQDAKNSQAENKITNFSNVESVYGQYIRDKNSLLNEQKIESDNHNSEPEVIESETQQTKLERKESEPDKTENTPDGQKVSHEPQETEKLDINVLNHESELVQSKAGGVYLPPAKLAAFQSNVTDAKSDMFQRLHWISLKKTINGLMNKVNADNIVNIIQELLEENVIRARGIFIRALMNNQQYSPTYTNIYAAMIAVINTKFPQIGELCLKRLVLNFKAYYSANMREQCVNCVRFLAHLTNQHVCSEILVLEILFTLLDQPTPVSIEVACGLMREAGQFLEQNSCRAANAVFERLRTLLYEVDIPKRSQYMIEVLMTIRRDKYTDNPAIVPELELIDKDDQFTHEIVLDEDYTPENGLNVYKYDENFEENEKKYAEIRKEVLGDDHESEEDADEESDDESNEIEDQSEMDLVSLRRSIYLTITSSLDCDECVHKLMKINIKPYQFIELARMIVDSCAQLRSYEKFFGFVAQRICLLNVEFKELFAQIFRETYEVVHHLETTKIRNIGRIFAHLLGTGSLEWDSCLKVVHITENTTTSSQRILLKIVFQELASNIGIPNLQQKLLLSPNSDDDFDKISLDVKFQLFPQDDARNARFAINFFTAIDLGPLTDNLRSQLQILNS